MRLSFPEGKSCAVWLLAMLIGGCGEPQQASSTPPLRPVKWLTVAPVGSGQQQVFTGQVRSAVHSTLSFKVSGTVAELPVDVGDRVLAGELIASLVPVDYEIGVEQANASVDSADAEFRSARANYDRIRALYMQTLETSLDDRFLMNRPGSILNRLAEFCTGTRTPVVTVVDGGRLYDPLRDALTAKGIPVFSVCDQAIAALSLYIQGRLRADTIRFAKGVS